MKKIFKTLFVFFGAVLCLTGCSFGGDDSSKYDVSVNAPEKN